MEEDIKILETFKNQNFLYGRLAITQEEYKSISIAIENITKRCRELEERDKERKTRIGFLETKLFNLRQQVKLLQAHRLKKYMMDNYVEKLKIKQLKEENEINIDKMRPYRHQGPFDFGVLNGIDECCRKLLEDK